MLHLTDGSSTSKSEVVGDMVGGGRAQTVVAAFKLWEAEAVGDDAGVRYIVCDQRYTRIHDPDNLAVTARAFASSLFPGKPIRPWTRSAPIPPAEAGGKTPARLPLNPKGKRSSCLCQCCVTDTARCRVEDEAEVSATKHISRVLHVTFHVSVFSAARRQLGAVPFSDCDRLRLVLPLPPRSRPSCLPHNGPHRSQS